MAGISDKELVTQTGYPQGVNNVAPAHDFPRDDNGGLIAVRDGVNVDFVGPSKKPRRRDGYAQKVGGRFHSPGQLTERRVMVAVRDGDLCAYDRPPALTSLGVVRYDVGDAFVSYAEVNGDLYWSNGREFRCIRNDNLADIPGWIDCPGAPQVDAIAGGGMAAGAYKVAMTWFDADGRESGALGVAEVDVPAGYGVQVHSIPVAPEGAVKARVYISPPNEQELYAASDLLTSATNVVLGAGAGDGGRALETLWRYPLPPCETLRHWNGRLIGASGNLLVWSDALRPGLTTHDNYFRLGALITLLEGIGAGSDAAGVWVADHQRTYWMAGPAPATWRKLIKYDYPAVPGSSVLVKGTDIGLETTELCAFWLAANGVFCAGLPGGTLVPLTEGRLALPDGERGATLFREHNGLRQLITSFLSRGSNGLAIGDHASATVTQHP